MSSILPKPLEELIGAFGSFPAVCPRTAERYALRVVRGSHQRAKQFSARLSNLHDEMKLCPITFIMIEKDEAESNLYVSGKENEYQQRIILSSSNKESKDTTAKSLLALNEEKFISLAQASYKSAAVYMKDALMLLDNYEFYNKMYKSKIDFLEIYNERNDINKERKSYWLDKLSKLLKQDSSAYMLNLAGLINLKLELKFHQKLSKLSNFRPGCRLISAARPFL